MENALTAARNNVQQLLGNAGNAVSQVFTPQQLVTNIPTPQLSNAQTPDPVSSFVQNAMGTLGRFGDAIKQFQVPSIPAPFTQNLVQTPPFSPYQNIQQSLGKSQQFLDVLGKNPNTWTPAEKQIAMQGLGGGALPMGTIRTPLLSPIAQKAASEAQEVAQGVSRGGEGRGITFNLMGEPLPWEAGAVKPAQFGEARLLNPEEATFRPPTPKTQIKTDQASLAAAQLAGGTPFGQAPDSTKQAFADWVNARAASKVEGFLKQKEFSDLNSQGIQGIFNFQAGDKTGRLGEVKNYFDNKYQELQDAGVKFGYKADYLPQLWQNTPQEVAAAFGRKLGLKPSFTLESVIKDYQEGIAHGLTPKFNNISDLAGWYEQRANKALADRKFFDFLANQDIIKPAGQFPGGITLDPDRFPHFQVKTDQGVYGGTYKAAPPVAKLINNYLQTPEGTLNGLANIFSLGKRLIMSTGIPETGLNPHGTNIFIRGATDPGVGPLKTLSRLILPGLASRSLEANLPSAPFAVKAGLNLRLENTSFQRPIEDMGTFTGIAKKYVDMFSQHFEAPLFSKVIPSLMLDGFNNEYQMLLKNGVAAGEAAKAAAEHQNVIFGNINWEAMGRSHEATTIFRLLAFAPQWLEANARLGAGIAKAFLTPTNPIGMAYRRMGLGLLGAYTSANVLNYKTSGHFMYQNAPGHTFEIDMGYAPNGQKRYFRPFGTAVDFVRLPLDVVVAAYRGYSQGGDVAQAATDAITRIAQNRLSTPLSILAQLTTGVDAMGHKVQGLTGRLGIASTAFTPGFVKGAVDYLSGNKGAEQSLAESTALPFRYSGGPATQKVAVPLLAKGASNQEINTAVDKMIAGAQNKQKAQANLNPQELAALNAFPKTQDPQAIRAKANLILEYPNLLNYERNLAVANANGDMSKVSPLLQAPADQALNYYRYQTLLPGSQDAKDFYKAHPEVAQLGKAQADFYKANPTGQEAGGRLVSPAPSDYVQQQLAAKNYNDSQVQAYFLARAAYDNQVRESLGLTPMGGSTGGGTGSSNYARRALLRAARFNARAISPKSYPSRRISVPKQKTTRVKLAKGKVLAKIRVPRRRSLA